MAKKTFTIQFNGQPAEIEYEDDLPFGKVQTILKNSTDVSDWQHPKADMPAYQFGVLAACITKAPFKIQDVGVLGELPSSVVNQLVEVIMNDYGLIDFLGQWMKVLLGKNLQKIQSTQ